MTEEKGKVLPMKAQQETKQVKVEALNDFVNKELKAKKLERLLGLVNGKRVSMEMQATGSSSVLNDVQYIYDSREEMWYAVVRTLDVYTINVPVKEDSPATPPTVETKEEVAEDEKVNA